MVRATRFTDPAAVDAWDNWFRWRDPDCLRDRTIDATWWRVANAIAPREDSLKWAHRYVDAFSHWELLPDERLLRWAGTGADLAGLESPCATLNAAAFVIAPHSRQARFDTERFSRIAAMAVRMLDDALVAAKGAHAGPAALRIGLIGFADALSQLGIDYCDPRAAEQAAAIGSTLTAATLQSAVELTAERGPLGLAPAGLLADWRARRVPDALVDAAAWRGIRHRQLTAIESQPRLALLANRASDGLEPQEAPGMGNAALTSARAALRDAIQPWIDGPIEGCLPFAGASVAKTIASNLRVD